MSETFQSHVGVDLHKCTVTLTVVDAAGEITRLKKISTKSTGKIDAWLRAAPGPVWMAALGVRSENRWLNNKVSVIRAAIIFSDSYHHKTQLVLLFLCSRNGGAYWVRTSKAGGLRK